MKINAKIYNSVKTTPFDVQNLENGSTVELHSLNKNEELFNLYGPKAKFAIWTCNGSKNYRLLIEDGYYAVMRELYGKRVNLCWINFWDEVDKKRKKIMLTLFLPLTILVLGVAILLAALGKELGDTGQMIAMVLTLVFFIVGNVFINKKIDKVIQTSNSVAVENIKNIVGHKHFDELLEAQRVYYDEFFGITEDEESINSEDEVKEENKEENKED